MFKLKTKIFFGKNCIKNIEKIEGKKAVIFSSNSMIKYTFTNEIINTIKMPYSLIKNIKPEPEEKYIEKYVKILNENEPDIIIAIGGGSVIDTAKASLYNYKNARLIAIPSTSGSGSEVTAASVLKKNGLKYSIVADYITPSYAFLDPRLPEKMPSWLTAYTGMDALSHAMEAYVSKFSSPFSDAFAINAIKNIFSNLYDSFKGNIIAREVMHYASCMAGIAILNARVGMCHAMAHKLGVFNLPHGLSIALLLDYIIQFNMKDEMARKKYDEIAKELHLKNADGLVKKIKELKEKIGIKSMKYYVKEEDFKEKIGIISREASNDTLMKFNPIIASKEEVREIYEKAYYGN